MQALSLRDKRPHEAEVNRAKVRAGLNRLRFYGFIPKNACFFFRCQTGDKRLFLPVFASLRTGNVGETKR